MSLAEDTDDAVGSGLSAARQCSSRSSLAKTAKSAGKANEAVASEEKAKPAQPWKEETHADLASLDSKTTEAPKEDCKTLAEVLKEEATLAKAPRADVNTPKVEAKS